MGHRVDGVDGPHPEAEPRPGEQVGRLAHRLHPACDRHLRVARPDRHVGEAERAHARGADLVDRLGGDLLRDPRPDLRLARGDLTLAGLQDLAEEDLLHLPGIDSGAVEGRLDRVAAEIGGLEGGDGAAHLAEGRPCCSEDDCAGHRGPFVLVYAGSRLERGPPGPAGNDTTRAMRTTVTQNNPADVDADLLVAGLYEGEDLPESLAGAAGAGDARGGFKKLSHLHSEGAGRALVVGLGKRDDMDAERARIAAAIAAQQARDLEAASIAWLVPEHDDADAIAEGLVTGTILGAYRFDRFLSEDPASPRPPAVESLTLLGPESTAGAAETARVCAEAQNRARDLQSLPSNVATPSFLAARAEEIASSSEAVSVEVLGRQEISAKEMGGLVAVSQGTEEEPRLIVLRYSGGSGPTLGLVGKGVTFDTGGISLKPSAAMHEM